MRFEFERVVREVNLGEYIPEMEGNKIPVWVNVPRDMIARMFPTSSAPVKVSDPETLAILHELWNNPHPGPFPEGEGEEWSMEDIKALYAHCNENDPQLWIWLVQRTWKMVWDYRTGQKKE